MKDLITRLKLTLILLSPLCIAACGGGSSDSGGAQNNVTTCVERQTAVNLVGLTEITFRNTCDFAINLGYGVVSIGTIVTLEPNASTSTLLPGGFIACRPPSQPFDRDDSTGRDFACTN